MNGNALIKSYECIVDLFHDDDVVTETKFLH